MTGVINKLSTEEIEKFGLIINSDYHNSYSTLKKLYKYIYPLYPKLKKEDISIKNISLKVYKEKKINSPKVKKLLSDFRRLLEDFLLNTEFEKDVSLKDIMLLRKYRSLGLKNEYRILLKRIRKKYYTGVVTDINIYHDLFLTEDENFNYCHLNNDNRIASAHELKSKALSIYFVAMQLKNYYDKILSEIFVTKDSKAEYYFYENVMEFVEKNIYLIKLHHPYINMLYLILRFYENYDIKYLKNLEDYYERSKKNFTRNMIYDFNEVIIGAYKKMRSKNLGNVKEANKYLFELCDDLYMKKDTETIKKFRLDRKYLMSFVSIINIAITLNKKDWLKSFIFKYHKILTEGVRDDIYNFGFMKYYYFTGEYEKAIFHGSQVSGKFPNYYYLSKIIIIRSYFELGNFVSMHTVFSNLKKYLTRNKKLNDFDYDKLKLFLTTFGKFIKIVENSTDKKTRKKNLEEFRIGIMNMKVKPDSYMWFLEKSG